MNKVTLITPVYNAFPWLEKYLESVLNQDYRPLQFIVVDDGSDDESFELLESFSQVFFDEGIEYVLLQQNHSGQTAAVNLALPSVSGSYFTWCDADDILFPESLSKRVQWLEKHPNIDMVRGNVLIEDQTQGTAPHTASSVTQETVEAIFDGLFHEKDWGYSGAYMVRTDKLFEVYPKKRVPDSGEGQNLQLLLPLASRGLCGYIPDIVSTYTRRPEGHSSQRLTLNEQLERLLRYKELREMVLEHCDCDKVKYQKASREVYEESRRKLLRQAALNARRNNG